MLYHRSLYLIYPSLSTTFYKKNFKLFHHFVLVTSNPFHLFVPSTTGQSTTLKVIHMTYPQSTAIIHQGLREFIHIIHKNFLKICGKLFHFPLAKKSFFWYNISCPCKWEFFLRILFKSYRNEKNHPTFHNILSKINAVYLFPKS